VGVREREERDVARDRERECVGESERGGEREEK
jgi:hypothetical protein